MAAAYRLAPIPAPGRGPAIGPNGGRPSRAAPASGPARTPSSGRGGFADDTAPPGCLVAVPDPRGGWAVGETLAEARAASGKVQGRRSGQDLRYPLEVPPGDWDFTLQTTWVEPAYLEPDASWCLPGGQPAHPAANGGAFGGKVGFGRPGGRPGAGGPVWTAGAGGLFPGGRGAPRAQAAPDGGRHAVGRHRDGRRGGGARGGAGHPGSRPRRLQVVEVAGVRDRPCRPPSGPPDGRRPRCCWPPPGRSVTALSPRRVRGAARAGGGGGPGGRRRDRGRCRMPQVGGGVGRRRAIPSTRPCCAPTSPAPPTWPSAGSCPRASRWARTGVRRI